MCPFSVFVVYKSVVSTVQKECSVLMPFGNQFTKKKSEIFDDFFSSSGNAIWSILLKYQEMDVHIQTFTDED